MACSMHDTMHVRHMYQVRGLFDSEQELLDDRDFNHMLQEWLATCRLDNMHVERLFALLKSALGHVKHPLAEKIGCIGVLAQWRRGHRSVLGDHAGVTTRKSLLAEGAPIKSNKRSKVSVNKHANAAGGGGGFMTYLKKLNAARLDSDGPLDKEAYTIWLAEVSRRWSLLSDVEQATYKAEETRNVEHRRHDEAPDADEVTKQKLQECLLGLADERTPLRLSEFLAAVRQELGLAVDANIGGFTRYEASMREAFCKKLFIRDKGDSTQ